MHKAPSLPSLLRTTGLIKVKKGVPGVAALSLQYWSPPPRPRKLIATIFLLGLEAIPSDDPC